jgi:hypothetical protein
VWKSPTDGVNVNLNLTVTLLNREFFGENRTFCMKKATYSKDNVSNGNRIFIKIGDLLTHRPRFMDSNGEFQVRLLHILIACSSTRLAPASEVAGGHTLPLGASSADSKMVR